MTASGGGISIRKVELRWAGPAAHIDGMTWLRQLLDWQREASDPSEFLDVLRFDLSSQEVYVFTPKGAVAAGFAARSISDLGNPLELRSFKPRSRRQTCGRDRVHGRLHSWTSQVKVTIRPHRWGRGGSTVDDGVHGSRRHDGRRRHRPRWGAGALTVVVNGVLVGVGGVYATTSSVLVTLVAAVAAVLVVGLIALGSG